MYAMFLRDVFYLKTWVDLTWQLGFYAGFATVVVTVALCYDIYSQNSALYHKSTGIVIP